jgi:hypothetical protein
VLHVLERLGAAGALALERRRRIVRVDGQGRDRVALAALARADGLVYAFLVALLAAGALGADLVALFLLMYV